MLLLKRLKWKRGFNSSSIYCASTFIPCRGRGKKREIFPLGQKSSRRKVCYRHHIDLTELHQQSNNLRKLYDDRLTKTSMRGYFILQKLFTAPKLLFLWNLGIFLVFSKIDFYFVSKEAWMSDCNSIHKKKKYILMLSNWNSGTCVIYVKIECTVTSVHLFISVHHTVNYTCHWIVYDIYFNVFIYL